MAFVLRIFAVQTELEASEFTGEASRPFAVRLAQDIHNLGLATFGTNLFYNEMTDTDDDAAIMVRDMGGQPSVNPQATVQILFKVRGSTWENARELAAEVYNRYHGMVSTYVTGYRIISAQANSLPASMGEDENERHIVGWLHNFKIHSTSSNQTDGGTVGYGGKRDPNEP